MTSTIYPREKWIDALKGFAIACVVIGHALERTMTSCQTNIVLEQMDTFIYGFHMPLFFMISGYLYVMIERKNDNIISSTDKKIKTFKSFFLKKFMDLGIPYLIFAVLVWIGKFIFSRFVTYNVNIKDLILLLVNPIAFLWFIYILFFVLILIRFLDLLLNNTNKVFIITIIMLLTQLFLATGIKAIDRVLFYSFFFYLGVIFYENKDKFTQKKISTIFSIMVFILGSFIRGFYTECMMITIIVNAFGSIMFFQLFYKLYRNEKKYLNILLYLGSITMYIYILHPVCLNALKVILMITKVKSMYIWLGVLILGGIIMPVLYYMIAQKIKICNIPFRPRKYLCRN